LSYTLSHFQKEDGKKDHCHPHHTCRGKHGKRCYLLFCQQRVVTVTPSYTHLHREAGRDDHEANPFLLAKWRSVIMVTHSHCQRAEGKGWPWPLPSSSLEVDVPLTSRGKQGRGFHDLSSSPLGKWRSVITVTSFHFHRESAGGEEAMVTPSLLPSEGKME